MIAYQRSGEGDVLLWFPGNWWASLMMSVPSSFPNPLTSHPAHHLPHRVGYCSRTLLQTCKLPPSIRPLMSLLLILGSSLTLESGQGHDLKACGVQSNTMSNIWLQHSVNKWVLFQAINFVSQFNRLVQLFATPMDCSMPGFPVHHQHLELAQTHVHRVSDAIQPSHPLAFPLLLPSISPSIRVFSNESVIN